MKNQTSFLDCKKHYLQIALNGTLEESKAIIRSLPKSDRIIIEAGTPLIKRYGAAGIREIVQTYEIHFLGFDTQAEYGVKDLKSIMSAVFNQSFSSISPSHTLAPPLAPRKGTLHPYVVADMKMMDRGETEVEIAAFAGARGVTALGHAPIESLNIFIEACEHYGIDSMIDMMNVEFPISILRQLKKQPRVVILHRGVDEERFNKEKMLPLHEIRRTKGAYDMMIAVAGGDTIREVQSAVFNDSDIVIVWKDFFHQSHETRKLATQFLEKIQ